MLFWHIGDEKESQKIKSNLSPGNLKNAYFSGFTCSLKTCIYMVIWCKSGISLPAANPLSDKLKNWYVKTLAI